MVSLGFRALTVTVILDAERLVKEPSPRVTELHGHEKQGFTE